MQTQLKKGEPKFVRFVSPKVTKNTVSFSFYILQVLFNHFFSRSLNSLQTCAKIRSLPIKKMIRSSYDFKVFNGSSLSITPFSGFTPTSLHL